MTAVELERLKSSQEEFYEELLSLHYSNVSEERSHLYNLQSDPTRVIAGGIWLDVRKPAAWQMERPFSEIANGAFAYGYVGSNVGAYFYYHDTHDGGSYISTIGTNRVLKLRFVLFLRSLP